MKLGSALTITTPDAGNVEAVVLIRNAALTHLVDGDQRSVLVPIAPQSGGQVEVTRDPALSAAGGSRAR